METHSYDRCDSVAGAEQGSQESTRSQAGPWRLSYMKGHWRPRLGYNHFVVTRQEKVQNGGQGNQPRGEMMGVWEDGNLREWIYSGYVHGE